MIQLDPGNREEIRLCIQNMDDQQLLRYGQSAKYMSSPDSTGAPSLSFLVQLEEARAEWRRRHPKPPLSESL